jgi:glycine/D-amino acid oxidase-like deaminating enzyme
MVRANEAADGANKDTPPPQSSLVSDYTETLFRQRSARADGTSESTVGQPLKGAVHIKTAGVIPDAQPAQGWFQAMAGHVIGPVRAQVDEIAATKSGQAIEAPKVGGVFGQMFSPSTTVQSVMDVAADVRKGRTGSLGWAAAPPLLIGMASLLPGVRGIAKEARALEGPAKLGEAGAADAEVAAASKIEGSGHGPGASTVAEVAESHGAPVPKGSAERALVRMTEAGTPMDSERLLKASTSEPVTATHDALAAEQRLRAAAIREYTASQPTTQVVAGTEALPGGTDALAAPAIKRAAPDSLQINSVGHATDNPEVVSAQQIEGTNRSYFQDRVPQVVFPSLGAQTIRTDVVIVGGGVSGANTASQLARQGFNVTVLDAGDIAGKTSGMGGSFITRIADGMVSHLPTDFAQQRTALFYEAHQDVMGRAQGLSTLIPLANRRFVYDPRYIDGLSNEFNIMKGYDPSLSFEVGPGAFPQSAAAIVEHKSGGFVLREFVFNELNGRQNIAVFGHSPVSQIDFSTVGKPLRVRTAGGGMVEADHLVFATGGLPEPFMGLQSKISPVQSFSLTARTAQARTMPGGMLDAGGDAEGNWDPLACYNYFRQVDRADPTLIMFGGADRFLTEENAIPGAQNTALIGNLRRVFPDAQVEKQAWSGILHIPNDDTPIVDQLAGHPNIKILTGPTGIGVIASNAAAKELTTGILRDSSTWDNFFTPNRISLAE